MTPIRSFEALEVSLQFISELRPLVDVIQRRDGDLASQLKRSASSVALNLSEGNERIGKDRLHLFRIAAGSAAESQTSLRAAKAWGYVTDSDTQAALTLLDRVRAMVWRLTHSGASRRL